MTTTDKLTEYAVMLGRTNEPLPEGWTVHKGDGCVYFRDGNTVRTLDLEGMLREMLAHRRASQAAPAPSDALREAINGLRSINVGCDEDGSAVHYVRRKDVLAALSTPTEERQ